MDASARLGLAYLAPGQLQKHVTLNETLTRLDALVQTRVASRSTAAQPSGPADGDLHILPASPTGAAWAAFHPQDLVRFEAGGWAVVAAVPGALAWVEDEGQFVVRGPAGWTPLGQVLGAAQGLGRLGLNTTADAANPFAARINKALWTAIATGDGGDGDLRMTFNKEGAGDVGSLLFQSGWSGRAELGLIGDDDLSLKVSADGSTWRVAMTVDRTTGAVAFPTGAGRVETTVMTASGTWTPPAWARRIEAVAVGGSGGGGGGAGGVSLGQWSRADLGASLTISLGAGGSGGAGVSTGTGADGAAGSPTTLVSSGVTLLTGLGGAGGKGGSAVSGLGGAGGAGAPPSNAGGDSRTDAAALAGAALQRPDGGGGGGAGGGLDAANAARAGGAGGAGASLQRTAAGGGGGSGAAGGAGAVAASPALSWAGGGGGGGGASTGTGYAGGAGAAGAGGGGGGAGVTASGAGGAGGPGLVRLVAIG